MPKIDGLQACMRIREFSNVPIIMLTARSEDTDKIIGFECGADDYITKPFNILELKARVRALLRRAGMAAQKQERRRPADHGPHHPGCRRAGRLEGRQERGSDRQGVRPDGAAACATRAGCTAGRTCSTWCGAMSTPGDYRTVDVHVRRLREKLELDPANPEYILTKWGVGYYLKHG